METRSEEAIDSHALPSWISHEHARWYKYVLQNIFAPNQIPQRKANSSLPPSPLLRRFQLKANRNIGKSDEQVIFARRIASSQRADTQLIRGVIISMAAWCVGPPWLHHL